MSDCPACVRLEAENGHLEQSYRAAQRLAEEGRGLPATAYIRLRTAIEQARTEWESARLKFLEHERGHFCDS